jgi:hypothetical protein
MLPGSWFPARNRTTWPSSGATSAKQFAVAPYPASVSTPDDRGDDAGSEHKWERPLVKVEITTVDFAARRSKP